ncbi:MAG: hypothetical protein ABI073_18330 [Luteolibacter sp.]
MKSPTTNSTLQCKPPLATEKARHTTFIAPQKPEISACGSDGKRPSAGITDTLLTTY